MTGTIPAPALSLRATVAHPSRRLDADLARLGRPFRQDLPIAELEQHEGRLRAWLLDRFQSPLSTAGACRVAQGTARIGLLRKYKPYAIKAASPAGYSLFLQRPGQGFSFQRHLEPKDEIFHILQVQEVEGRGAGYVFLCTAREWDILFRGRDLERWSADPARAPDEFRARCFVPEPGDVFGVDGPDVVHTVIGCHLEEFATSSGDRVDRLFDQNAGRRGDDGLDQAREAGRLNDLPPVFPRRRVHYEAGAWYPEPLVATGTSFGRELTVTVGADLRATFLELERGNALYAGDAGSITAVTGRGGKAGIDLRPLDARGEAEWREAVTLGSGESAIVPPGFSLRVRRAGTDVARVSIHAVATRAFG